jgi:hypothetical protein
MQRQLHLNLFIHSAAITKRHGGIRIPRHWR